MVFIRDLCDISDILLFGQVVSKRENPPHQADFEATGAGDGARTRDNLLGRQGLCQLSYSRIGKLYLDFTLKESGKATCNKYGLRYC